MSKLNDLTGRRFGRLIVVKYLGRYVNTRNSAYECLCDCGNSHIVRGDSLTNGKTASCGCLQKETASRSLSKTSTKHGLYNSNPRLYGIWMGLRSRCSYKKNIGYANYGGRGISVCEQWNNSFQNFYHWSISHGYNEDLTIDRIDVNKGYSPENCKWATVIEQHRNCRNSVYIDYNGHKIQVDYLCENFGINKATFLYRLNNGMPVFSALTAPIDRVKSLAGMSKRNN